MSSFICKVSDPSFTKDIKFNNGECNTIGHINGLISYVLQINQSQFIMNNPPKDQEISSILNGYQIEITIQNRCNDVEFRLPDGKLIKVNNCYRMKIPEVIECFEKNGFYCTPQVKRYHIEFIIPGNNNLIFPYPFFAVPIGTIVDFRLKDKIVTLDYDQKKFNFYEGEFALEAHKTFLRAFEKYTNHSLISIINNETHEKLPGGYGLKCREKYTVLIMCPINFRNKSDPKYHSHQNLDYFAKISDAKQQLASIFSTNEITVKPINVVIYDKDRNEITNENEFLREIRDNQNDILYDFDFERKQTNKHDEKQLEKSDRKKQNLKSIFKPTIKKIEEKSDKNDGSDSNDKSKIKHTEKLSKEKDDIKTVLYSNEKKLKEMQQGELLEQKQLKDANYEVKSSLKSKEQTNETKKKSKSKFNPTKKPESKIELEEKEEKNSRKETTKDSRVKIHFVFEGSKEEEDSSFDEYFDSNTTVEEIENEVKTKIGKEDKITLEYEDREDGEKISLGRRMKINNILEDIKTKTKKGQPIYILYIKIKKPTKSTKTTKTTQPTKSIKPKITKPSNSSSDSDSLSETSNQSNQNHSASSKRKSSTESDSEEIKNSEKNENDETHDIKSKKDKDDEADDYPEFAEINESAITSSNIAVNNGKCKYFYQTNREDKIEEIELDAGTSVEEMKQIIAENNGVDSLSNIKVIFAGKDLLNELILDDLEIGDIPLYVYIRSTEDILLMTAKALVVKKEDLDFIEEEEETE